MSSNSLVSNETQQISHELNVDSASNDVPIQRPIGVRSPAVKRRNKSVVWDYFKITGSPNKKVCQVENCNFKYSMSTANTSLSYHLRNAHNIITVESVEDEENAADDENSGKKARIAEKAKHSCKKQKEIDELLVKFVVDDIQSFNLTSNETFLNLVSGLDKRYVVPNRDTIRDRIKIEYNISFKKIKDLLSDCYNVNLM